ncbi:MAG TPA: antibiotic biosynthesis monooxygenase family protein [Chloroflexota bacterium]|jgi:heme-degrading monooxygenase HmoA
MFIAVTRIKAPREAQERMAEGFRRGGPELKRFPGFVGFELWRNDDTLEAVSRWESREAMEAYRASPMFGAHHGTGPSSSGITAETVSFDAETVV